MCNIKVTSALQKAAATKPILFWFSNRWLIFARPGNAYKRPVSRVSSSLGASWLLPRCIFGAGKKGLCCIISYTSWRVLLWFAFHGRPVVGKNTSKRLQKEKKIERIVDRGRGDIDDSSIPTIVITQVDPGLSDEEWLTHCRIRRGISNAIRSINIRTKEHWPCIMDVNLSETVRDKQPVGTGSLSFLIIKILC